VSGQRRTAGKAHPASGSPVSLRTQGR
jgi:hypothetical protein